MAKYKLIKKYPGSPELDTIGYKGMWTVPFDLDEYPEFWSPINEYPQLTTEHIRDFIKIETYRLGGFGGQHVNKGESAIRLMCDEFSFKLECGYHRSLLHNKDTCLGLLESFLDSLPDSIKQHYLKLYKQRKQPSK